MMKTSVKVANRKSAQLREGFALLLILVAITLLSLLALGMLAMSERDRLSARGITNSERTELLAQAALEHATALLDHNIPQPLPPGIDPIKLVPPLVSTTPGTGGNPDHAGQYAPTNWVVNPGQLTLISGANTVQTIPLYTQPDPTDPNPTQVDLNAPLVTTISSGAPVYPIRGVPATGGTPPPCLVDWVNVLKDPTKPASKTNPIVGRYGFWLDDESAKVNVNMAYGKPTNVNLTYNNPLSQVAPHNDESEQFDITSATPTYNVFPGQITLGLSPSRCRPLHQLIIPMASRSHRPGLPSSVGRRHELHRRPKRAGLMGPQCFGCGRLRQSDS